MIRTQKILEAKPYYLICQFNNGEIKKLLVEGVFADSNTFSANKILEPNYFSKAEVGELGQIFWPDAAYIKDVNGNLILCEYDMSPEFVYHNSIHI